MKCLSTAVGGICPRLLQMVKIDTGKAGTGHRKTFKNDKEEKVLNTWHFPGGSVVKNLPEMQGTCIQSPGRQDRPEEEIATHSSILAWRIPWTEKPGRLHFMESQRVEHDLRD